MLALALQTAADPENRQWERVSQSPAKASEKRSDEMLLVQTLNSTRPEQTTDPPTSDAGLEV